MNNKCNIYEVKKNAPGEDRTHDLKIMRLTRCLLRYRGPRKVLGSAFDRESSDLSIYIRKHE